MNSHLLKPATWASLLGTPTALLLDQSGTPQTITGGIPNFAWGLLVGDIQVADGTLGYAFTVKRNSATAERVGQIDMYQLDYGATVITTENSTGDWAGGLEIKTKTGAGFNLNSGDKMYLYGTGVTGAVFIQPWGAYSGNVIIGDQTDDGVNRLQVSGNIYTPDEITGEMAKVQTSAPTSQVGNLWLDTDEMPLGTDHDALNHLDYASSGHTGFQPVNHVVVTKTTTYTILSSDDVIICNSASPFTVTLPDATGSGKIYIIKNINSGLVTLEGDGADTIDGDANQSIYQWDSIQACDYAANTWGVI